MVSVSVLKSSNTLCLCVYDVTVCRFTSRKCYLLRVELFSSKRVFFIYRLFRQFCSLYNFLSPENFIRFSVKLVTEPTTNTFFFFVNLCVYFSFFILIDTTDNKFKMYHLTKNNRLLWGFGFYRFPPIFKYNKNSFKSYFL